MLPIFYYLKNYYILQILTNFWYSYKLKQYFWNSEAISLNNLVDMTLA